MSAGISGSNTVFSAATIPVVSCSSSSEGMVVAWMSGLFGAASASAAAASVGGCGVPSDSLIPLLPFGAWQAVQSGRRIHAAQGLAHKSFAGSSTAQVRYQTSDRAEEQYRP